MQYFIKIDEWKTGPFDFRGISTLQINKNTLIWYEGLHEWTKAGEILEFTELVNGRGASSKSIVELLKDMNFDLTIPYPDSEIAAPERHHGTFIGFTILTTLLAIALLFLEY